MKEVLIIEFKAFLKENDALGAFLNGLLRSKSRYRSESDPIRAFCLDFDNIASWIDSAFTWSASFPDDHPRVYFWTSMNGKWATRYHEIVTGR